MEGSKIITDPNLDPRDPKTYGSESASGSRRLRRRKKIIKLIHRFHYSSFVFTYRVNREYKVPDLLRIQVDSDTDLGGRSNNTESTFCVVLS